MRLVCGAVLLVVAFLARAQAVEPGCDFWHTSGLTDVCCDRCKPGNRLMKRCGPDPRTLCVPCGVDTYTDDPRQDTCSSCTQCKGIQRVKENCTADRDTVCECVSGHRCGDPGCSFCVQECGQGQQPIVNMRTCQACPAGFFNDQIHQHCVQWTSCQSDQKVVAPGTAVSDVVCGPAPTPKEDGPTPKEDGSEWTMVIAIFCVCLVICLTVPVSVAFICQRRKVTKATATPERAAAGPWRTAQLEECSFCFPQQEHGGSSNISLASLVSEEKLSV